MSPMKPAADSDELLKRSSAHLTTTSAGRPWLIMGEREFGRFERVAEQLRKELAWILEREMDDPRVGFVTVSRVDLSKDLRNAKIFIAVREGQGTEDATRLLNRASGFLRGRLAARMRMRYVPHIRFANDEALDQASRIDALLENAKARRR